MKENYLERIPEKNFALQWSENDGIVTLTAINRGFFNRLCQRLLKKPKTSCIRLDEVGSFVWKSIDGKKDIIAIGAELKEHFGDSVSPLYLRLARYFSRLDDVGFIKWV